MTVKKILSFILIGAAAFATGMFSTITILNATNAAPAEPTAASAIQKEELTTGELTTIGKHVRALVNTNSILMPSGDRICINKYLYGGPECNDENAEGLPNEADRAYVFRHEDKQYTVKYNECTEHTTKKDKTTHIRNDGCTVIITTAKYDATVKQEATLKLTLGAGIELSNKPHPRQDEVKTLNPILKEDPLVAIVTSSETSSYPGFARLFKSAACGGDGLCSQIPYAEEADKHPASRSTMKLGVATPRGQATFTFTPSELFSKTTKSIELKGASVTFAIKNIYFEKCSLQHCEHNPQPDTAQLLNRIDIEINYKEN